jgi:regulator of protease activity HflC (stomatin/prohibitin superfamily)
MNTSDIIGFISNIYTTHPTLAMIFIVVNIIVWGGFLGLFILPLIPNLIKDYSNNPNANRDEGDDYEASEFGFFTKLSPKQVKIIIGQGDNFITCIMGYKGHTFRGLCDKTIPYNSTKHWNVISTTDEFEDVQKTIPNKFRGKPDANPISDCPKISILNVPIYPIILMWYVWKRWVYWTTGGYVFTGISPWRKVRTYPIERIDKRTGDLIRDYSDHLRVGDFEFPVITPESDTQDNVPVRIDLTAIVRVYNPYEAAYGTDNWASRLTSAVRDAVTSYTRPRPLNEVLSAKNVDPSTVNMLAEAVMLIGSSECSQLDTITTFGLTLTQVLVSDISVPLEMRTKLADAAQATVDAQAIITRAQGEARAKVINAEGTKTELELIAQGNAAGIREQSIVTKEYGNIGLAVLAAQRDRDMAKSAGEKGIVIIGGNSSNTPDPIQVAMLQELKDLKLRNQLKEEE